MLIGDIPKKNLYYIITEIMNPYVKLLFQQQMY